MAALVAAMVAQANNAVRVDLRSFIRPLRVA
jgi:hypothetical protein